MQCSTTVHFIYSTDSSYCSQLYRLSSVVFIFRHLNWALTYIQHLDMMSRVLTRTQNLQQSISHFSGIKWAASWQNQKMTFMPSEDSDQPGHPPSLIRVFLSTWHLGSLATHWAHSEDFDQTGRMPRLMTGRIPRLIRIFAGRTCHIVGFVRRQLKFLHGKWQLKPASCL